MAWILWKAGAGLMTEIRTSLDGRQTGVTWGVHDFARVGLAEGGIRRSHL